MSKPNAQFAAAVNEALQGRSLTLRQAEYKTGLDHTTITRMANGLVPSRGKVIEWAEGLGEDINHWLAIAGYDPIPPNLCAATADMVREQPAVYLTEEDIRRIFQDSLGLSDTQFGAVMREVQRIKDERNDKEDS